MCKAGYRDCVWIRRFCMLFGKAVLILWGYLVKEVGRLREDGFRELTIINYYFYIGFEGVVGN